MDSETQHKIEETVLEILKSADMEQTTEFKVRSMAAERLGLDLSVPDRKLFVRQVVESFLQAKTQEEEQQQQQEQGGEEQQEEMAAEAEEEEEDDDGKKKQQRIYDDEGDLIICNLNKRRRVTIQEFRGKMLVSIREYYEKDGKQLPSSKVDRSGLGAPLKSKLRLKIEEGSTAVFFSVSNFFLPSKWTRSTFSTAGISLTAEQWEAFSKAVPKIEEAIKKLEGGEV